MSGGVDTSGVETCGETDRPPWRILIRGGGRPLSQPGSNPKRLLFWKCFLLGGGGGGVRRSYQGLNINKKQKGVLNLWDKNKFCGGLGLGCAPPPSSAPEDGLVDNGRSKEKWKLTVVIGVCGVRMWSRCGPCICLSSCCFRAITLHTNKKWKSLSLFFLVPEVWVWLGKQFLVLFRRFSKNLLLSPPFPCKLGVNVTMFSHVAPTPDINHTSCF